MHESGSKGMDSWIADVRARFEDKAPELLPVFDIYAAEALFGRGFIARDVADLNSGARILEVGAGSFLLSCQLVREGFAVSALEPVGTGFSHFSRMRQIVLELAQQHECVPEVLDMEAESLDAKESFDYAFSINVMEHVQDVRAVLANVTRGLVSSAKYRFTCPNYLFPYEPHFNIPTLFSKRLTERFLWSWISNSQKLEDPLGTWQSLNWITIADVKKMMRHIHDCSLYVNRKVLVITLERIVSDPLFAARRSRSVRLFLSWLVRWRLHSLFGLLPAAALPVMDCTIHKNNKPEVC